MVGVYEQVQNYYGKVLKTKQDLQTSACCPAESLPDYLKPIVSKVHPEILERFYGCGVPLPSALEGCTVLDLGSGTGRDVYVLSQLVGEKGFVIGVDMTEEQLEVAHRHIDHHMKEFRYAKPNVSFRKGFMEDLKAVGIEDNSIDLVVSNCVFNLSPNKEELFKEVFRVLKPAGELYFSDVFTDRRLSAEIQGDAVLRGECLGGALYVEDYRRMLAKYGCQDGRTVSTDALAITNPKLREKLGAARFWSLTKRAFKLDLEDRCEDYGQVAYYQGTIPGAPSEFKLDDHHTFHTHKPMLVCGNTANMVSETRFGRHFEVVGDQVHHLGLFDCASPTQTNSLQSQNDTAESSGGSCC